MSMSDIDKKIQTLLNRKNHRSVFKKSDVLQHIDMTQRSLDTFKSCFKNMAPAMGERVMEYVKSSRDPYATRYLELISGFQGKAQQDEKAKPMHTCMIVAEQLMTILDKIQVRVRSEFEDTLNLYSARYGHIAILGSIDVCDDFAQFCIYLYQGVFWEISKETSTPPMYRLNSVTANVRFAINVVNSVYSNAGVSGIEGVLKELQNNNNDIPIIDDNGQPNTKFFNVSKTSHNALEIFRYGIGNVFFFFGRLSAARQDAKMKRLEYEREWMEAKVALLKMDLEKVDKDSPEYRRLVKIIDKYEEIITKYDRKINAYYEEVKEE